MFTYVPLFLLLAFGLLAVVFPLARLLRRHGVWGVVRGEDPVQAVMVPVLLLGIALALAWTGGLALLGPDAMGVWRAPPAAGWLGAALGGWSLALVVLAQKQMGASWRIGVPAERTGLVTGGIFRWIRHPIYTGVLGLLGALVLLSPSPWTVMGGMWLATVVSLQARLEERHLAGLHGDAFTRWARTSGRFFPGVGRI